MGIDQIAVLPVHAPDGLVGLFHGSASAAELLHAFPDLRTDFIAFLRLQFRHELPDLRAVIAGEMIEEPLQIAGDQNVHGGGVGQIEFPVGIVNACVEKVGQHPVLIGSADEPVHRNPHLSGIISRQDISEVSGGHHDVHRVALFDHAALHQLHIAPDIVGHLRHQPADVDGIGR